MVKVLSCEDRKHFGTSAKGTVFSYQQFICNCLLLPLLLFFALDTFGQRQYVLNTSTDPQAIFTDSSAAHEYMQNSLTKLYNRGHALALWQLDSIGTQSRFNITSAYYSLIIGPIVYCDSLVISDPNVLRYRVLSNMLQWKKGGVFIKKTIDRNITQVDQNGVILSSQHQYYFEKDQAQMRIQLQKQKKNEINAIVGAQPGANSKTTLIGEATLRLRNALSHAESIDLQWQRQSATAQRLQFQFDLPYCFNTSFGWNILTDFYYKDQELLQTQLKFAGQYKITPIQYTLFFIERKQTTLLNDINNINVLNQIWGVMYQQKWLLQNISLSMKLDFGMGKRIYKSNFDKKDLPLTQFSEEIKLRNQIKNFFWQTQFTHWYLSPNSQLQQEWRRIGGTHTLRGLAQESLFIREGIIGQGNWGVGKQASNQFYVYTDYGQLCDNLTRQFYPVFSYGLGAQFTTPSGQIQMDYGWSKFDQTPIEYRNGIFNLSYQVYF